jgi:hypothetical protein
MAASLPVVVTPDGPLPVGDDVSSGFSQEGDESEFGFGVHGGSIAWAPIDQPPEALVHAAILI